MDISSNSTWFNGQAGIQDDEAKFQVKKVQYARIILTIYLKKSNCKIVELSA